MNCRFPHSTRSCLYCNDTYVRTSSSFLFLQDIHFQYSRKKRLNSKNIRCKYPSPDILKYCNSMLLNYHGDSYNCIVLWNWTLSSKDKKPRTQRTCSWYVYAIIDEINENTIRNEYIKWNLVMMIEDNHWRHLCWFKQCVLEG